MKSTIGGIYYVPNKRQNLDIYGEPIELPNLVSYRHQPVKVDEEIKGYQPQYSFNKQEERTESPEIVAPRLVTSNKHHVKTDTLHTSSGSHKIESGVQIGNMQSFLDEAAKHGIYFRVTSGLRPGAKTSSGKTSWHSSGDALDITPLEGQTWDDLRESFRSVPELLTWMQNQGYGILDETTEEMLAKTKGTGAHFHIGKDQSALAGLQQFLV